MTITVGELRAALKEIGDGMPVRLIHKGQVIEITAIQLVHQGASYPLPPPQCELHIQGEPKL